MKNEKKLFVLPVPACPDLPQRERKSRGEYGKTYYDRFRVQLEDIGGEKILGVTIYAAGGTPLRRWWTSRDQYGYQVFRPESYDYSGRTRDPGRLYDRGADQDYFYYSWGDQRLLDGESWDRRTLLDFCGAAATDEPGWSLALFHKRIREEKLKIRQDRERDEIRADFAGIEGPGEDFRRFCIEVPLREYRYLFYEYTGKKVQTAFCSHCGAAAGYTDARERQPGHCKSCGTEAVFRSLRKLRRAHSEGHREYVACLEKHGERLLARDFHVGIRFEPTKLGGVKTETWTWEHSRVFLDGEDLKRTTHYAKGGTYAVTVDGFHRERQPYSLGRSWIAPLQLREIREQYGIRAPLEELSWHGLRTDAKELMTRAQHKPAAEYLIKNRLWKLAEEELQGMGSELLPGKKSAEILGVPPQEIEKLRQANVGGGTLALLRTLYSCGYSPKAEDMAEIDRMKLGDLALPFVTLAEGSSVRKAINYLRRQQGKDSARRALQHWWDYRRMADMIGLDTGDPQIFMPKDLQKAHDEAAQLNMVLQSEKRDALIAQTADRLGPLCWQFKGLSIFPARSQAELVAEGQSLHHCVGRAGYGEKMAAGTTAIFFIRKVREMEKPYVTLELDLARGKVIQCYADHDSYPGARVKAFTERWERERVLPGLTQTCRREKQTA